uniref:Uncharacterized protein n=1 Tax=Chromera velia CCMP2878 TaxID=1169474 RepID=A0A0G4GE00_9ALVE|eukprot:Cvel_21439.t1-p1 / transcript=Cvel_21439.t1 / gene=Cvel_21439 / organism=Chromera_velia_CCMP2878 / gene_product=hypothetical protein / transcript_product=hypothetical protein / location=Cvel_scaffold2010:7993-16627(+) / protein_length=1290 / sequence_SO=supercontig / SO=protein_coding / is_pseudo=false
MVEVTKTRFFTSRALEIMRKIPKSDVKPEIVIKKEEDLPEVKQKKGVARLFSTSAAAATTAVGPSPMVEEPFDDDDKEAPHFRVQVEVLSESNEEPVEDVQAPLADTGEDNEVDVMEELFRDQQLDGEEAMRVRSSRNPGSDGNKQIQLMLGHHKDDENSDIDLEESDEESFLELDVSNSEKEDRIIQDFQEMTLSQLAKERESFRLAWLNLFLLNQNKALGKVPVAPPRSIDLSDSVGVKGRALPLLLRFLERLQAAREDGVRAPRLKQFTFADNPIGLEGIGALTKEVKEGKAASLHVLDLEKTGLEKQGMKSLSEAMKEKSLLTDEAVKPLAESMGRGDLMNLEVLDLGGNCCWGRFLGDLGGALRADVVPHLRELSVTDARGSDMVGSKEPITSFLSALSAPECPPSLQVRGLRLTDGDLSEEEVCAVGASKYRPLRTLDLSLPPTQVTPFLEEVVGAEEAPTYEVIDLCLHFLDAANEGLSLVGEAIQSGRFACVRKLWVGDLHDPDGAADPIDFVGGKTALFTAFSPTRLPLLSEFQMHRFLLTDADITRFAEAVRVGNLSGLRVLQMRAADMDEDFGQEGMDALIIALVESGEGLPFLNELDLRDTKAGEAAESWERVFASGKLPCLSDINLSNTLLTCQTLRRLGEAVRGGGLVGVLSLDLSSNTGIGRGVWGEFMRAVAESERGMPKLKNLNLMDTPACLAGGPVSLALGSGKVSSLEDLGVGIFYFDQAGVGNLEEAVRTGQFPPRLDKFAFQLSQANGNQPINLDGLVRAIAESGRGLPSCIASLGLSPARFSEQALVSLTASGGSDSWGKLSQLKCLDLSSCRVDNARLKRLAEVFSAHECRELQSVNLQNNNQITAAGVSAFLEVIAQIEGGLPKLKSLDLQGTGVELIGGKVALAFTSWRLPSLEGLGVDSFVLDSMGAKDLGEAVRRGGWPPNLRNIGFLLTQPHCEVDELFRAIGESERGLPPCVAQLRINGGRLSEEALAFLATNGGGAVEGRLSHLKYLELSSCGIDNAGLGRLGEVFSFHECRELEHVNLRNNNQITAAGVFAFFEAIAHSERGMPKLKRLDFQGTGVEFIGGKVALAFASGMFPSLEGLGVDSFFLDSMGVKDLGEAVRRRGEEALAFLAASGGGASGGRLLELKYLDLSRCGIDDAGLGRLGEVFSLHECRALEVVALRNNKEVTAAGVSAFFGAITQSEGGMPNLKQLNLLGTSACLAGGPIAVALTSGKVPSLEGLGVVTFSLDVSGVEILGEAVRRGGWPSRLKEITFELTQASTG